MGFVPSKKSRLARVSRRELKITVHHRFCDCKDKKNRGGWGGWVSWQNFSREKISSSKLSRLPFLLSFFEGHGGKTRRERDERSLKKLVVLYLTDRRNIAKVKVKTVVERTSATCGRSLFFFCFACLFFFSYVDSLLSSPVDGSDLARVQRL